MMHNGTFVLALAGLIVLGACTAHQPPAAGENPLLAQWDTPFEAPPFDKIKPEHFEPAFEAAMAAHDAEVAKIASNPEPPSFANTVEALERSGQLLERVRLVFINLNEADSTPELQALARKINPRLSVHEDEILMNAQLFQRIRKVWNERDTLGLTAEQERLLEKQHREFVQGGAELDAASKAKLKKINEELSSLSTRFGENLLKEMNRIALLITDEKDLDGLPPSVRESAAALAKAQGHEGAWAFNLQRTSWTPFLQYSTRRDLRQKLYTAYTHLCANGGKTDNRAIASRIASLRVERAHLLGYPTHAAYVLDGDTMAEKPENVFDLLGKVWPASLAKAKAERDALQALANRMGDRIKLASWDWWYYAEKLRAEKYDFDENAVKPYLQLGRVRQAAFDVANKLWGITFTKRDDVPVYEPDVTAWEVKDADGSLLGLFYTDYFARESKRGGAWMDNYRQEWKENGREIRPIVVNVCNFARPAPGQPALLSLDEATTVFHEFGHALQGLLARGSYASLSGTNVARDFVEFPSQMMENWALDPEVLPTYALSYKTGEPIPAALIAKMQRARTFNQGFATTEYLAASYLDMDWHTLKTPGERDAGAFEAEAMRRIHLIPEIVERYKTPYFGHIFGGGYSAGYYSYIWAEVLVADGFDAFQKAGIFNKKLAEKYRENILEAGDSEPPMVLYERFRGAKPSIEPLLRRKGLE